MADLRQSQHILVLEEAILSHVFPACQTAVRFSTRPCPVVPSAPWTARLSRQTSSWSQTVTPGEKASKKAKNDW